MTLHPGVADAARHVDPIFKMPFLFLGMTIFLVFPFTRLVHVWSAPVWYLGRNGYPDRAQPADRRASMARDRSLTVADLVTRAGSAMPVGAKFSAIRHRRIEPCNRSCVNDAAIPHATIAREVQNHAGGLARCAWEQATRALVIRELLPQRARALDLVAEPRDRGRCAGDRRGSLDPHAAGSARSCTPKADDAVCRRYYDSNHARFRSPDLFEPAHILFKARRDDAVAYAKAVAQAAAVLADLQQHPDSSTVWRAACPIARRRRKAGGWDRSRGATRPRSSRLCSVAMEPGQICPTPVRTRYGVHVLRLDRKIAGETLPFDSVRTRIATYLEERTWRRAVAQYIALVAGQARIAGFDLPAATSPLVQ